MNEAETGAEHIDPALKAAGWGVVDGSKILREHSTNAYTLKISANAAVRRLVNLSPPTARFRISLVRHE